MPEIDRISDEFPSDQVLLAAIERAERHRFIENDPGQTLERIKRHLGLPHNGWTTRQLRPQLARLQALGLVEAFRRHSRDLWQLTPKGKRRLAALRRTGDLPVLPESPQHQLWREARTAASERIAGFREDVRGALAEAMALLGAADAPSDAWFEMSHSLQRICWRLGSATYCLSEWAEPDDAEADIDPPTHKRGNRRNIGQWERDRYVSSGQKGRGW